MSIAEVTVQQSSTPFVESTKAVFSTMLGWEVKLTEVARVNTYLAKHDVSGIIGFSGAVRGTVVISLDQEVALSAVEAFLGMRPTSIDADVMDSVGELANMVAGGAKERIGIAGIGLGLPTSVAGKDHRITFEPGAAVELLQFSTPHGPFSIEIGMREAD